MELYPMNPHHLIDAISSIFHQIELIFCISLAIAYSLKGKYPAISDKFFILGYLLKAIALLQP
jgi:hypothetical protein